MSASVVERPVEPPRARTGSRTLEIVGDHDISTSGGLAMLLADATAHTSGRVTVDLSGVTFMDASVIRVLLTATGSSRRPDGPWC